MKKVNIIGTDLEVSNLSLGTYPFGYVISEQDSFKLLDAYINEGGNLIDTAHMYGTNNKGSGYNCESEKAIGKWMEHNKNRHSVVISTKGGSRNPDTRAIQSSEEEIVGQLDRSLENLKTDYIDIYWLHRDDIEKPVSHYIDMLNKQVKAGKIRYFGCSNWEIERIIEADKYAKESGQVGFTANQVWWSLVEPNLDKRGDLTMVWLDDKGVEYHKKCKMPVLAYSPQAGGFFSKLENQGLEGMNNGLKELYFNERNISVFEVVKNIAKEMGRPINDIVLSFLLSQPFTVIPIIGGNTIEHIKESSRASELILTDEIIRKIGDAKTK